MPEVAEDQDVVADQVDKNGDDAGDHGDLRLADLAQGAAVGVAQGEGHQAQEHHMQVAQGVVHGGGGIGGGALAGQVQADERPAEGQENARAQGAEEHSHQNFEAEGVADALVVLPAHKLGGEDARAGGRAEDAQVEDEHELVDDGHAAHGDGAHLPHHHIVQHLDKICDAVLDHHGQSHGQDPANHH